MSKVDIDLPSYSVITTNAALLAVRRVSIEDNSLVKNGYVDHFGGVYEVTHSNRAQMEALLSNAPAMTGNKKIDEENLQLEVNNLLSIREIAEVYSLEADIKFPILDQIKKLAANLVAYVDKQENVNVYSLNYQLSKDSEDSIHTKIKNLRNAVLPLSMALSKRDNGLIRTSALAKGLKINSNAFGLGRVEEGLSLSKSRESLNDDGSFRF